MALKANDAKNLLGRPKTHSRLTLSGLESSTSAIPPRSFQGLRLEECTENDCGAERDAPLMLHRPPCRVALDTATSTCRRMHLTLRQVEVGAVDLV